MAPECFACPEGNRLRWSDRLDIICLGRCSCTNQVSSVSLSVLCRQRMNISPVTQQKKKKKKNVLHVPEATVNLFSVKRAVDNGAQISFEEGKCHVYMGPTLCLEGISKDGLIIINEGKSQHPSCLSC